MSLLDYFRSKKYLMRVINEKQDMLILQERIIATRDKMITARNIRIEELYDKLFFYDPIITTATAEIFKDKKKEFRFRIKAKNRKIIAVSEGYKTKTGAQNGIKALKLAMRNAEVKYDR